MLGRVVGSVWGSIKAKNLEGYKFLEVIPLSGSGYEASGARSIHVALDSLQAGVGDIVLVGHGTRIRDIVVGEGVPVKSVVIAIVDSYEIYKDAVER